MGIEKIVARQRIFFERGNTKMLHNRKVALKKLYRALKDNEEDIINALYTDLGKSDTESKISELSMIYSEIEFALKNIDYWTSPKLLPTSTMQIPATAMELPKPYGVVLIMAPWNYPILLTLSPLVGAIAAGNCAVIKPSNYAVNCSRVIKELIKSIYPEEFVTVIEGGREENKELLEQKYDYIFFTGGKEVGKVVQRKAAEHLTPTTLELGGKSPCIVDDTANIKTTARRIVFGKFLNSGQTCIAPDYILVDSKVKSDLIFWLICSVKKQYGEDPLANPDYPKMINQKHFYRVEKLIRNEDIVFGGSSNPYTLKIEPTILDNVTLDSPIMQEEIFGPVLPIISYDSIDEAEEIILKYDKPLALYLFTKDASLERRILSNISFGGGCVNDTIMHIATPYMGFGGVGESGMGSYHGKYGFDTFSHYKSILRQCSKFDIPVRYQPYTYMKKKIINFIFK